MKALHPQRSSVIIEVIPFDDTKLHLVDSPDSETPHFQRFKVVCVGPGKLLDDGRVIDIPLKPDDEVIVDARFTMPLLPPSYYDGRKLMVVDYAGVLVKVEREPGEKVSRFAIPQQPPQQQQSSIVVPTLQPVKVR